MTKEHGQHTTVEYYDRKKRHTIYSHAKIESSIQKIVRRFIKNIETTYFSR
jgi:hypothetical protein